MFTYILGRDPNQFKRIKVTLINEKGVIYIGNSIQSTAKALKIPQANLTAMVKKRRRSCGGWKIHNL